MANTNLHKAKSVKENEFFTQLSDIENELKYYKKHFRGKIIFLNCDDPSYSMFWKYFEMRFDFLGLKKLISTHYETDKPSYKLEIVGDITGDGKVTSKDIIKTPLRQNGDFRSDEAVEILKEADIIVTNPPFSLFREYIAQLMKYEKKFLIIGSENAITYKEIFPILKNNAVWLGVIKPKKFLLPNKAFKEFGNICWFTNLIHYRRNEDFLLYKEYNEEEYSTYDNYDAINVDKVKDIPIDYDGIMGVPISFLKNYNPDQFKIIGLGNSRYNFTPNKNYTGAIKHMKNGLLANGSAINMVLTINTLSKPEKRVFYTANNIKGYLIAPYARILIKTNK